MHSNDVQTITSGKHKLNARAKGWTIVKRTYRSTLLHPALAQIDVWMLVEIYQHYKQL